MEQNGRYRTDPHIYGQLKFEEDVKAVKRRKDGVLGKQHWKNWVSICKNKQMKFFNLYLTPFMKSTQNGSQI